MSLMHFRPFATSPAFTREIDRVFDSLRAVTPPSRAFPPLNVWEDAGAVYVEAELPGFKLQNLDVTLERDVLTLKGHREITAGSPPNNAYLHRERAGGAFTRSVRVGEQIDGGRVTATLADGVLTVTLPKAAQTAPRTITVTLTT